MKRFLFVGENPSLTAVKKNIVWADGGLAARQLFDALRANKIDPQSCVFLNLFGDQHDTLFDYMMVKKSIGILQSLARTNRLEIVAMGRKVERQLRQHNVEHRAIVHPAARGSIRAKAAYAAHIKERLAA